MLKTIPLSELEQGMYVLAVNRQDGQVAVKTQGWVKSAALIEQLKRKGIQSVTIDTSKTIVSDEEQTEQDSSSNNNSAEVGYCPFEKTASVASELKKATKLYNEAKSLQKKALEDIKAGRAIDVEPMKELTAGMIDSIFRNQDALACLTRIREKDAYLMEHSLNVSILMAMFAKHLELPREEIELLSHGAFLHDIGKVLVPDEILHKPGRLTDEEFQIMKTHVQLGVDTLRATSGISEDLISVVAQHHERLDGAGYPKGLKEQQITKYGRMISIVDIYDAMTAERVYKKGMPPSAAFKIMTGMVPDALDGDLLRQFIRCVGIHPVGTLVKLTSGKLAIVTESNFEDPLKPIVKVFYNSKFNHYTEIKDIDLSKSNCNDAIEISVKPEQFKIELNKFFKEVFLAS